MSTAIATIETKSVTTAVAERYGMTAQNFEATLRSTVVPKDCSKEQFAAFLLVAKEYGLNPILKEIYAFPARSGGIQPIVSIDGWMRMMNDHRQMDGLEFVDHADDDGKLKAITARIYRKDRSRPIEVTEYMDECKRDTDTWRKWPTRMLRHKAAIQCARYAFGFSGIVDEDEYERAQGHYAGTDVGAQPLTPPTPPSPPPAPAIAQQPEPPKVPEANAAPKEKVPAKRRRKAGENRGETPPADPPAQEPEPPVEQIAEPDALPGGWDAYLTMMVEELRSAKDASDQHAVHETVADAIQGDLEKGKITGAQEEAIKDAWEKRSGEVQ